MSIKIQCIVNKPISSNSYVLYNKSYSNSCIVIDPGTLDCKDLISFLEIMELKPEWILLTHEHFDHIWGVNRLKELYGAKIACSKDCSNNIIDKKKNLSVFYDQIGFDCSPADLIFENVNNTISWGNVFIQVFKTVGHSIGSISILINRNLFCGDLLIWNQKTITKLPGGCKLKLQKSLQSLRKRFLNEEIKVYPGHGPIFYLHEVQFKKDI